jgi:hypothetical protein
MYKDVSSSLKPSLKKYNISATIRDFLFSQHLAFEMYLIVFLVYFKLYQSQPVQTISFLHQIQSRYLKYIGTNPSGLH